MIKFEDINVNIEMNEETFNALVNASPLTPEEKEAIPAFFKIYEQFIDSSTEPLQAWVAIRNIILLKRAQDEFTKNSKFADLAPIHREAGQIPVALQEMGVNFKGSVGPIGPAIV